MSSLSEKPLASSFVLSTDIITIKEKNLRKIIRDSKSMVIAYSGGVDSTLVAKVAYQELGEKSLLVIANSPSLARQELHDALTLAKEHGFPIRVVNTNEINNPLYRANTGNRCYFCKQTLYKCLEQIRIELGFDYLANGDHWEDRFAPHRPGQQAAKENQVKSVLFEAGFTKTEIRIFAKKLGLPNHNKPSSPCLSSRILVGSEVTWQKLQQVEKVEHYLKSCYAIKEIRVRYWKNVARIETLSRYFPVIKNNRKEIQSFFKKTGFKKWILDSNPLKRS